MIFDADLRPVVDDVLGANTDTAPGALWALLTELGWPVVGVAEDDGGAGGDLAAVAELAAGVGRHAVAVPLIETGLAAWALAGAGLPVAATAERAAVALAPAGSVEARRDGADGGDAGDWIFDGTVARVRWLSEVPTVVLVVEQADATVVAILDAAASATPPERDLADEPSGTLRLDGLRVPADRVAAASAGLAGDVLDRVAVLRAAAISGAVERACTLTKDHVTTRQQFGRPLSALPAVRQLVAGLAVERDLLDAALSVAVTRPGRGTAAAARAVAARSAGTVATDTHQLHGAIGITQEYPLHLVTRRLWSWRDDEGTQRRWERLLGDEVVATGSDEPLWALVTGASV
ncbi:MULTISPECIES: acyl-CoA dehydrogenase family protein [Frankia]|uniref:Acyl-CoA dehydrogenase n=1 Tax=Frankia alni (strain DSM 45986 / CECT 9034 / ACN14a) TaxID=326424 RepID=Q0RK13_FRAAA|nr:MULTISPECIES: acyl-CoA dehydrogenase family protein [Frankia]CAJ62147.1 Putative acyl-CoA dehydrogenase [Frankia alni ACN14a]